MDPTPLQKVINIIDILVFGNKQHEKGKMISRINNLEKKLGIENVGEMTIPPRIKLLEKRECFIQEYFRFRFSR